MNKAFFKNCILTILSITVFFLSLEVIQRVRYWKRYDSIYWVRYGFISKMNQLDYYKMQLQNLYGVEQGGIIKIPRIFYDGYSKFNPNYPHAEYYINSFGFRNYEFTPCKKNNVYRIAVVGDSTVFGVGVADDETFPVILENEFKKHFSERNIEVINFGIPSFTTQNMKNIIKYEILDYLPDMIVVYGFFNDVYYSDVVFKKNAYFFTLLNSFLLERSVFYFSFREKICKMLEKDIGMLYRGSLKTLATNLMNDSSILSNLNSNLKEIIDMAKSHNIEVVLGKQPFHPRDINIRKKYILVSEELKPFYGKIYSLIDNLEEKNSIKVISTNEVFEKLSDEEKNRLFLDGVHLSQEGNKLLASVVFQEIETCITKE